MNNPGIKIKELRKLSGMSQEELGRRIGVQRAAIQKYEKGTVENIPIKSIENIATVFDVSPTYILGWNETASNPLAIEVKVVQGVKNCFGAGAVDLLETFTEVNHTGQQRLLQYADEVHQLYGIEDECKVY